MIAIATPRELIEFLALTRAGYSREEALKEIEKSKRGLMCSLRGHLKGHRFCHECSQLIKMDICYSCGLPHGSQSTEIGNVAKIWRSISEEIKRSKRAS